MVTAELFRSTKPMGFAAGDTNLYRYVGNNPTNATDPTGLTAFDATRSYLQNPRLAVGDYMRSGDTVIKTGSGTIRVESSALDAPLAGKGLGKNQDKTYEQAKCVLSELGFELPSSQNGVYWAKLAPADLGYTVDWAGAAFNRLSYSFLSNRYRGAPIKSQLFQDLLVTLWHEVKGHNVDGAQHRTPQEEIAFDAAYDAQVKAAIAAAKANGSWKQIVECECVNP